MYMHLSLTERALIEKYLAQGLNFSQIAERLGRSRTTISREVKKHRSFALTDDFEDRCLRFGNCHRHRVRGVEACPTCKDLCKFCLFRNQVNIVFSSLRHSRNKYSDIEGIVTTR